MNRRDMLVVGSAAVAASVTANLLACADKDKPGKPAPAAGSGAATGSAAPDPHAGHGGDRHGAFTMAAAHCVVAGDACLAHCLDLLGDGDTTIAGCAKSVREMLAVCHMVGTLAASSSPHLAQAAALCAATCKDCKAECDKHADKHPECKACADACEHAIAQAAKIS